MSFMSQLLDRAKLIERGSKVSRLPKMLGSTPEKYFEFGALGGAAQCSVIEDFHADAGATLLKPWGAWDVSSSGSPAYDFVADAINGVYSITLATTTEAEIVGVDFADQLVVEAIRKPVFLCRAAFTKGATGTPTGDKTVLGLMSARNTTLDSVATNAWFMLTPSNNNIYVETDDGTTDTDDKDTGIDWVAGTYKWFAIDMSDLSKVQFWCTNASDLWVNVTPQTMKMSALSTTTGLQPVIAVTKAANANCAHNILIDYMGVAWDRTA